MDKKTRLNTIYASLLNAGVVKNKREFADLLEVNYQGLISAMSGRESHLTDSLIGKAVTIETEFLGPHTPVSKPAGGVWIPEETATMYNNMSETIRLQAEMIARLQGIVLPTQKNSLRDNK